MRVPAMAIAEPNRKWQKKAANKSNNYKIRVVTKDKCARVATVHDGL